MGVSRPLHTDQALANQGRDLVLSPEASGIFFKIMEHVTPPQRSTKVLETPPSEYRQPLSTPNLILSTPTTRLEAPSRKHLWSNTDTPRHTAQQDPNLTVPSTPLTSLESNDGSHIKTPFGNLGLWNATSPGVVDTPTPAGVHPARPMGRDVLPSLGAISELATPQFPSNPAQFGIHTKAPESPLAAKKRQVDSQIYAELQPSAVEASPGSVSSDDAPLRPLLLPIPTRPQAPEISMDEDQTSLGSPMDESGPVQMPNLESVASGPVTVDTSTSSEVESVRSTQKFRPPSPSSIPQSIRHWLEAAPPRGSDTRAALRSSCRREGQESTRKRLAQFTQTQHKLLPRLEPYVHEQLGRVLQPHIDEAEYYGILGLHQWPDEVYPWSATKQTVDTKQVQTRQRELEMVERYLEEGTSSSDESPPPEADPADALVALRSKRASRRLMQRRTGTTRAVIKTPPTIVVPAVTKKSSKAPVVTPPSINVTAESEMDVDKDSDEVACICKGPDDGRAMIQCDNCHSWLHVDCVTREEERSQLPDKWYCWKCPVGSAPERVSTITQPVFVPGTPEYPKNIPRHTAADVPVYQSSERQQASPELGSYPSTEATATSLLESGPSLVPFAERTPPPLTKEWPKYGFNMWGEVEAARQAANDRLDDPMTAIATTPFIGPSFTSPYGPYDDSSFDPLHSTPNRNFGLRFAPPLSTTPRKERPWTNYIGSFATPTNPTGPQLSPHSAQAFPIVQTDPLFIHYEHDAPKQTAHHQGRSKRKSKPKEKETLESDKGDDGSSVQAPPDSADSSNTDEIGPFSDSGTADASTPVGSQD